MNENNEQQQESQPVNEVPNETIQQVEQAEQVEQTAPPVVEEAAPVIPDVAETVPAPAVDTAAPAPTAVETPQATYFGRPVAEMRGLLLKGVLGCLIAAASVAVIAILAGGMEDIAWRAIGTIFIAVVHIFLLFLVLPANRPGVSPSRSVNMVINALTVIVVASFFVSVANTWGMIDYSLAGKLYGTFIVSFFSLLHAKGLMDIEDINPSVRSVVKANYAFVTLVAALIIGLIYKEDNSLLSGFYGRRIAASLVVDVTLSIIVTVMHRLYLQKHPEFIVKKATKKDK